MCTKISKSYSENVSINLMDEDLEENKISNKISL
jgi:hypothetical protein